MQKVVNVKESVEELNNLLKEGYRILSMLTPDLALVDRYEGYAACLKSSNEKDNYVAPEGGIEG